MDSTENLVPDSLKSKKIQELKGLPSPSPSAKPLRRHQDSNPWSSTTPEKPVDLPLRTRNRSAAFSLKEVREAARKLKKSDPNPIEKPDPILDYTVEQKPFSPMTKPKRPENAFSLPEKYEMLDKFFHSLDSSIRLCRMKGSATSFTNVSPKIESLTDRRFTYSHLAQIKFILPEAIEIKKILILDDRTSCMKPDLLIVVDIKAIEDIKNVQLESGSTLLRKIFRSRLVDYFKSHPQDDDIPEGDLPEPFNASKRANQLNSDTFQESSTSTVTPQTGQSKKKPLNLSHMSQSFRRSFSEKAIAKINNQEEIVASDLPSRVSGPRFSLMNPKRQCHFSVTPSPTPKKLATPVKQTHSEMMTNPFVGTPVQSDSTPAKLTSATPMLAPPKRCYMTPDNDIANPLIQSDSTPAKLTSATPILAPPKRCYMTPDNDITNPQNKLVRRPSRSRSLKFDSTTEKNPELENDGEDIGCLSVEDDLFDVLPESLIRSIKEKETKALYEQDPAISQAKRRKQMIACLPKLFDMIYFLFQSIRKSVLTKEELLHKVVSSNLDIVDRKEAEEQLRLLQELAPEWIYEKMSSSGDCLLCVNKITSVEVIRSRLAEAI